MTDPMLFGFHLVPLLGTDITVGDHYQVKLGPLTINLDTVWATLRRRGHRHAPWRSTSGAGPPTVSRASSSWSGSWESRR